MYITRWTSLLFLSSLLLFSTANPPGAITWASHGPFGGPVNALAIDPLTPSTLYAGTEWSGVFKSTDAGDHWNAINTGLTNLIVSAIAIDPLTPSTLYAGTDDGDGGIFKSVDGGAHWTVFNIGLTSTHVRALAINPRSPGVLYAGTEGGGVFSTHANRVYLPVIGSSR